MRTIKFRVWDKENRIMIYPNSLIWFGDESCQHNGDMGYILQQFTGLRDFTGKGIYEGDVVQLFPSAIFSNAFVGEVVFGNHVLDDYEGIKIQTPCFCFKFDDGSGYCGLGDNTMAIIGNIYEGTKQ